MQFLSLTAVARVMLRAPFVFAAMLLVTTSSHATASAKSRTGDCPAGIYQLDDGSKLDCDKSTIDFAGISGKRIPLEVTNVAFQGAGVRLAGRLVMPQGAARVPIV